MNAATQAISAALFLVERAAAKHKRVDKLAAGDPDASAPGLDGPLGELTGAELEQLAEAADVLSRRAHAVLSRRQSVAAQAEIENLKRKKV